MAGNQQGFIGDSGNSTSWLDLLQVCTEKTLATARFDELLLFCGVQGRGLDVRLDCITFQFGLVLLDVISKRWVHSLGQ